VLPLATFLDRQEVTHYDALVTLLVDMTLHVT
jgi:hypothetical protein